MIEIKMLSNTAEFPRYATKDSAGVDLYADILAPIDILPLECKLIPTGIAVNMATMPNNMMAIIVPRSGKGHKEGKVLGNSIGIIDQDYQGELMVSLLNRNPFTPIRIQPNEKFAQLIFVPIIKTGFLLVNEFSSNTARGAGGFGSTG